MVKGGMLGHPSVHCWLFVFLCLYVFQEYKQIQIQTTIATEPFTISLGALYSASPEQKDIQSLHSLVLHPITFLCDTQVGTILICVVLVQSYLHEL